MLTEWDEVFPGGAPQWYADFQEGPVEALDAFLTGTASLDSLAGADRSDLLAEWLQGFGEESRFATTLDRAATDWLQQHWGDLPESDTERRIAADQWAVLFDVVAATRMLPRVSAELHRVFASSQEFLGALSTSRDPYGRYLRALAWTQGSRALVPYWWKICELPAGLPPRYTQYALEGLRAAPAPEGEDGGGWKPELAPALMLIGVSLARLVDDARLSTQRAERTFLTLARLTLAAYPFRMWSDAFAEASPDAPPLTQEWLQKLGVRLDPPPQIAPRRFKETEQQRTVARPGAASTIAAALRRRETNAVAQAETLLAYQRRAVELHGDAHPFVQSLCWFAHEVDRQDPDRAVRWASEARLWEPWNHYTWITLLTAQRRAEGDDLAVATALEASERFPNVSAAWLELGISLRGVGATLEAEEALLEARHRFPDDPKTWSALGELFLAVDEPDRAIETLREAYLAFPSNPYLGPGLARALSQTGDDEEARRLLEQAAADFPNNELVRRRLTELRAGKRLPVERAERLDPGGRTQNPRALLARSKLLRRRARRLGNEASGRQAFELAEAAARLAPLSARASAEQALLLLEQERSHDAWNILQEAHQKHGDHLGLLYVEARVRRVEAENQRLPFSEETLDSIVGPLRSAARGNPFLRPFTDFQVGRACFSLHDGQPLEARRTAEVARLRAWLERLPKSVDSVGSAANIHEADNAFLGWWMWRAVEKNDDVLRGSKDADRGVRQNATFPVGKGGEIDSIEEDFPNRIITSAEFMLA